MPAEYWEAACEEGFLVSAEFPLGFGGPARPCWPHAMEEWTAIIKQLRNYPCVCERSSPLPSYLPSLTIYCCARPSFLLVCIACMCVTLLGRSHIRLPQTYVCTG